MTDWVFGYGSLIYKVDFPYLDREPAQVEGWSRRFWQGSHDHRGTPEAPGRVVTLVPDSGRICRGMAYRVEHDVFEHLDHREKNGYEHHRVSIDLLDRGTAVAGMLYVAGRDNAAFLGPDEPQALAEHIVRPAGRAASTRTTCSGSPKPCASSETTTSTYSTSNGASEPCSTVPAEYPGEADLAF